MACRACHHGITVFLPCESDLQSSKLHGKFLIFLTVHSGIQSCQYYLTPHKWSFEVPGDLIVFVSRVQVKTNGEFCLNELLLFLINNHSLSLFYNSKLGVLCSKEPGRGSPTRRQ